MVRFAALWLAIALGCVHAAPQEPMMSDPSHVAVTLELPYHPWKVDYDRLSANAAVAPYLPAMRAALEAPGAPEDRLTAFAKVSLEARRAAVAGPPDQMLMGAISRVDLDQRVAFFRALAIATAASDAPVEARLAALRHLEGLVTAPAPVGVPGPAPTPGFADFAQMTAQTEVRVQIEALSGQ